MLDLFNVLENYCVNVFNNGIPEKIGDLIHLLYLGIQIVIPIILIIFGMIELGKAVTSQKEDEIKKAQGGFFKKLILAVMVFLVFSIVDFVFGFAKGDDNAWSCVSCLIDGKPDDCQTKTSSN